MWHGTHKDVIRAMPEDFAVNAICARTQEKRDAAVRDFPGAAGVDDWRELVKRRDIDAVVVTTPIALSGPVTLAALEAGKDVFVEKPFCISSDEGKQIIDAEQRSGRHVYILEQLLYTEAWEDIQKIIDSGEIGRLVMFDRASHGFIDTQHDPWGFGKTEWRAKGEFPLGPLFDGGVHELAVQSALFGPVKSVVATGLKLREEHGEYDVINMMMNFPGEVSGLVTHSGMLGGGRGYFNIRGTEGLIVVEYWRIIIERKLGGEREVRFAGSAEAFFKGLHPAMWRELAERARQDAPGRYPPSKALHDILTLESIRNAIRSGNREAIG